MSRGGAERGGDTESEAGSKLWAVSTEPDAGLEPMNREMVTWAEVGRLTDWATQAPQSPPSKWTWTHWSGPSKYYHSFHCPDIQATFSCLTPIEIMRGFFGWCIAEVHKEPHSSDPFQNRSELIIPILYEGSDQMLKHFNRITQIGLFSSITSWYFFHKTNLF